MRLPSLMLDQMSFVVKLTAAELPVIFRCVTYGATSKGKATLTGTGKQGLQSVVEGHSFHPMVLAVVLVESIPSFWGPDRVGFAQRSICRRQQCSYREE